jgi:hypothetical protein
MSEPLQSRQVVDLLVVRPVVDRQLLQMLQVGVRNTSPTSGQQQEGVQVGTAERVCVVLDGPEDVQLSDPDSNLFPRRVRTWS